MLSEPEESLERRIRIMTMPFPKKPWVRGVLLTAAGGFLVAVACWAPSPTDIQEGDAGLPPAIEIPPPPDEVNRVEIIIPPTARQLREDPNMELPPPPQEGEISAAPTFTPFTVRPDIRNRAEIGRALEREYPPLLRDAGIGGTVDVWFFIDEEGIVQRTMIDKTSGHLALDDAALEVARAIQFTPALNRDKRVPVWISLPITFTTR
jgi:TonB family protein